MKWLQGVLCAPLMLLPVLLVLMLLALLMVRVMEEAWLSASLPGGVAGVWAWKAQGKYSPTIFRLSVAPFVNTT